MLKIYQPDDSLIFCDYYEGVLKSYQPDNVLSIKFFESVKKYERFMLLGHSISPVGGV